MAVIGLATFELHPTTRGGCGMLLHHAACELLERGHEVVFLLDIPPKHFRQFEEQDRATFPHHERLRAYHLRTLCADMTLTPERSPGPHHWRSLCFAHAIARMLEREPSMDMLEIFDYCGVGYAALVERAFGRGVIASHRATIATRLHNTLELIDAYSPTATFDQQRYIMYGLERAQAHLSESLLTPTPAYANAYFRGNYDVDPRALVVSQSPKMDFPAHSRACPAMPSVRIAYFGRLWVFKGIDQLVHASVALMRERPELDIRVDLIGPDSRESPFGDSYIEHLRSLVPPDLRERFEFPGHLSHDETAERLANATFGVFPNRFESFCYAAHEAYDAGLPLIMTDLPGWRDFFEHEKNALLYDGTTAGLLSAMRRMIDEPATRERLSRPYAVATNPLGTYYDAPRAMVPVRDAGAFPPGASLPHVLALVLDDRADDAASRTTLDALARQSGANVSAVRLTPCDPHDPNAHRLLGRSWRANASDGSEIPPHALLTRDALVIFLAGDVPASEWARVCAGALASRNALAFAGTWATRVGAPHHSTLDLMPEAYPFEWGARPTRALLRTPSGAPLSDVLDPNLGPLAEIGLLWRSIRGPESDRPSRGALLHEPLLELAPHDAPRPAPPPMLDYLVASCGGPFRHRLSLYTTLLQRRVQTHATRADELARRPLAPPPPQPSPRPPEVTLESKLAAADTLGGRTLAAMALRKLTRRLSGRTPAQ